MAGYPKRQSDPRRTQSKQSGRNLKRQGANRKRQLRLESLEGRYLLSSVPVLVDDVNPLSESAFFSTNLRESVSIGPFTYFTANDGAHGIELWRTDGTSAGTQIVKDIDDSTLTSQPLGTESPASSGVSQLTNVNGTLYFRARDASGKPVLYRSGGDAASTAIVTGVPSDLSGFDGMTAIGDKLFYTASKAGISGRRLWVTDSSGTRNLTDLNSEQGVIAPGYTDRLHIVNGKLIFMGATGAGGYELWSSDGTTSNTFQLTNINSTQSFIHTSSSFREQIVVNSASEGDLLYFQGRGENEPISLWVTNGTAAGTLRLTTTPAVALAEINGALYFRTGTSTEGFEAWKTDGTPGGTAIVADLAPGSDSSFAAAVGSAGSTVLLSGILGGNQSFWLYDGATAAPVTLPEAAGSFASSSGNLYFAANDPTLGRELFKIDAAGNVTLAMDLNPGDRGSSPRDIVEINGKLLFRANSDEVGDGLWSSEGDLATTSLVYDVNQNTRFSTFENPVELNGKVYFYEQEARGLLATDGTASGTYKVAEILGGSPNITRVGEELFYTSSDASGQRSLYKFDGATDSLVTNEVEPSALVQFEGKLYFTGRARDGSNDVDLWVSDGAAAGTMKVPFNSGPGSSPRFLGDIN
ncbi:MAG: hypothetical protein KDA61_06420, partial [Planctomycetales bacterium]|nr:hypothetical protein [Planctomycetales bacterium]